MADKAKNLPSVVIVGRPNVGKSTLFNAILGQRRSIVGDEPGITRDRIRGEATFRGRKFELIDTGGIVTRDEEMIPSQILKQARVALEGATQVVFLIDGRTEITGADRDLAAMLRKLARPVTLAVNKIDTPKNESLMHEFHAMGFENVFPVSAEHKLGIEDLLAHVTKGFQGSAAAAAAKASEPGEAGDPDTDKDADEWKDDEEYKATKPVKIAIIGRPNVGKSTLLNALTGTERAIVSPIAGTTRDAVDETVHYEGRDYIFVDTAGIRRKGKTVLMAEKLSVVMARKHLRMSHVALLVLDATDGIVASDATIAGYADEEGRPVIICVNKWDAVSEPDRRKFLEQVRDELKFLDWAPVVFMSAQKNQGTKALFPLIKKGYEQASRRIGTGEMNRFLETLKWEFHTKIKFITQGSVRPPTFVAFTDKVGKLHFSAERYLANRLREKFGFEGSPIVIKTKGRAENSRGERSPRDKGRGDKGRGDKGRG